MCPLCTQRAVEDGTRASTPQQRPGERWTRGGGVGTQSNLSQNRAWGVGGCALLPGTSWCHHGVKPLPQRLVVGLGQGRRGGAAGGWLQRAERAGDGVRTPWDPSALSCCTPPVLELLLHPEPQPEPAESRLDSTPPNGAALRLTAETGRLQGLRLPPLLLGLTSPTPPPLF